MCFPHKYMSIYILGSTYPLILRLQSRQCRDHCREDICCELDSSSIGQAVLLHLERKWFRQVFFKKLLEYNTYIHFPYQFGL